MEAKKLAKYIINQFDSKRDIITNIILQKILYIIQVRLLKNNRENIISSEFEAWHYGPVIREIYKEYSIFGSFFLSVDFNEKEKEEFIEENKNVIDIVDSVIKDYVGADAWLLVRLTHEPGGAWDKTVNEFGKFEVIPLEFIKSDNL